MHDAIPSRILNGWLRLEEDLFHLQVLSSLPPQIPICFIIANDLPKRNRSRPEHSGRLRSVHSINVCRPSAASTPPTPLSSLRSAPSASPHIPRACAHTHSARAFCRRSCRGVAAFKEVVVDLADAARSGLADFAHVRRKVNDGGHIRLRAQNSARLLGN